MPSSSSGGEQDPCTKNSPRAVYMYPVTTTSTAPTMEFIGAPITSIASSSSAASGQPTAAVQTASSDVQSFSRMPSQRRRRLWTLAARAAACHDHLSHEKDASCATKNPSTQNSSFLKPGTVRTQDSGISSMDYVTSRDANSPNSEGSHRQRASPSSAPMFGKTAFQQHQAFRPRCSTLSSPVPLPRTRIVVSREEQEEMEEEQEAREEISDNLPVIRYSNLCNTYVPEWVRRNWSSAPRPLISRQSSSIEMSYDLPADWAASTETLNMQYSLYPHHRRIFYGRYGRASCPKTTTFFEHHPPPPLGGVYMEEVSEEEPQRPSTMMTTTTTVAAAAAVSPSPSTSYAHPSTSTFNLRRRRFDMMPQPLQAPPPPPPTPPTPPRYPCWCERAPPPHAHTCSSYRPPLLRQTRSSMLSPFFHCGGCIYRGLQPNFQYDLPQRHVRRRLLKRMSSEPSQPSDWSTEFTEFEERRPAPLPLEPGFTSPPTPPPKRTSTSQEQQQQHVYAEPRIITATTKKDVFLRTSEAIRRSRGRLDKGGGGGALLRGRSVDEAYGWDDQTCLFGEGRRPGFVCEGAMPGDVWGPIRRGNDSAPGRIGVYQYGSTTPITTRIHPSSARTMRSSISPYNSGYLRPHSENGPPYQNYPTHRHGRQPLHPLHHPHPHHPASAASTTTAAILPSRRRQSSRYIANRSAFSSFESSDTAQPITTSSSHAPPWQIGLAPSNVAAATFHQMPRRICRSVGGGSSRDLQSEPLIGSMAGKRTRRSGTVSILTQPARVVEVSVAETEEDPLSRRGVDVKWKRKSFKRSNGYDASDVMPPHPGHSPRPTSSSFDEAELIQPTNVPDLKAAVTLAGDDEEGSGQESEDEEEEEEDAEETAEEEDFEDVDKVIASVINRTPNQTAVSTRSTDLQQRPTNELAALGFANRNDYWEHSAFRRLRLMAILLALMATLGLIYSLSSTSWVYSGPPRNLTQRGLWQKCSIVNKTCEVTIPFVSAQDGWQGAATCVLLVAIVIGLLGSGLALYGHSGSDLQKRLYYFHSSGEILFLAGFTTFLSLGIYRSYANLNLLSPATTPSSPPALTISSPVAARTTSTSPAVSMMISFGVADVVGWLSGGIFFAASMALLVDEFIDELAKLGQTRRWPWLARFLKWSATNVSLCNRRFRAVGQRCSTVCRRRGRMRPTSAEVPTDSSMTKSNLLLPHSNRNSSRPAASLVAKFTRGNQHHLESFIDFPAPYRPTTGASLTTTRRQRRWQRLLRIR